MANNTSLLKSNTIEGLTFTIFFSLINTPTFLSLEIILLIVGFVVLCFVQNSSLTLAFEILPLTAVKAINCISLVVRFKELTSERIE